MMRTVTKLVTKAKNAGHSLIRPSESDTPLPEGSRRFKASNVIANANTPSLNASIRTVSFSSRASRSIVRLGLPRHASGRFESASRNSERFASASDRLSLNEVEGTCRASHVFQMEPRGTKEGPPFIFSASFERSAMPNFATTYSGWLIRKALASERSCWRFDSLLADVTKSLPAPAFGDGRKVMYKSVADLGDSEMAQKTPLTRDSIIRALTSELRPLPYVHAFWEAGAAAFNRVDEWSDIDLYIVVDDTAVPQTFEIVEKTLSGQPVDSLTRGQLADLRFIDRPDGFVTQSEGPLVLRGQVVRVFDEREMLESSQGLGG